MKEDNMIKFIVSDLDGTLLGHDKLVHPRERNAIRTAVQHGIGFCLASGRMHGEMRTIAEMAGIGQEAFIIAVNGAFVYGTGDRLLSEAAFDAGTAIEVLEAAAGLQVAAVGSNGDINLSLEKSETVAFVNRRLMTPITIVPDMIGAIRDGTLRLCKVSFFGDMAELRRLEAVVADRFAGRATWYVTDKDCFDVVPFGVTKGAGLTTLLRQLGIRPEETVCIGDSFNDVPMFGVTPHCFAMAGSDPLVRKSARHIAYNVAEAVEWALERNREEVG
jgi:Cof subfamily protein (haloacid dehalogenase superfamily)